MTEQSLSGIDLGYPKKAGYQHLALYQPTLDAFVLVLDDLAQAACVSNLLTSRYYTVIVCLDSAENYLPNLIDNTCCEQWTCKGQPINTITNAPWHIEALPIKRLEPAPPTDWCTITEKKWAQLVWFWVRELDKIKHQCVPFYHQQKFAMEIFDVPELDFKTALDKYHRLRIAVYRTLFSGSDITETNQHIAEILSQFAVKI